MKKAIITGITGQDGSYLAEFLLDRGYEVHGIVRRVAIEHPQARMWRIRHILDRLHIHNASMESYASLFIFATLGNFASIILAFFNWKTLRELSERFPHQGT